MPAPSSSPRRDGFLRDRIALLWLGLAVIVALAHRWVPEATWLMVHLVLLGALTHSVLVWSRHFTLTLTRARTDEGDDRRQRLRLALLAAGTTLVLAGVSTGVWPVVFAGGTVVAGVVAWHGAELWRLLKASLPGRFRVTIHYYIAAAAALPLGAVLGMLLARGPDDEWRGRLLLAHALVNVLGWIGLTVAGTLVTLWPTMLRTRMDERAERLARQALAPLSGCVLLASAGALLGWTWLATAGVVGFLAAGCWWGRALLAPLRTAPPREFAPASVLAALAWLTAGLVWLAVRLGAATTWTALAQGFAPLAGVFAVGFGAQLLTGALSYLMPVVIGGGPSVVRASGAWFNRLTGWRLLVINAGLVLFLLPVPSWVRVTVSIVVLVALATFLPLMAAGVRTAVRLIRSGETGQAAPAQRPPLTTTRQLWAGALTLALAVGMGVAADPAALGIAASHEVAAVQATGHTTRVRVVATGMHFEPSSITVPRGDRLVIELVNDDDTTVHDLRIGAAVTPRLAPGETAELDAGVIGASQQGWCTVVGHRLMGMTLDIIVPGTSTVPAPEPAPESGSHHGGPVATSGRIAAPIDAALPALTDERMRKLTLTVEEVPLEVAPGVWQKRWTFNGRAPGPVLHGRVGDVFEITLVNDGSIGHSIDFHAGALAPDRPMRTIPPGESLTYRFTAQRAGVWMYHCSTMPMSAHIAAGMHGAVVIEPDGLPQVERSYLLVQSEVYLGAAATSSAEATEVDVAKISAERPDFVVFNGIAGQYEQQMLAARVGERVRFWVLAAGPNRATSFHIVGGQFDTVWSEGGYTIKAGKDAFGSSAGGSQALGLQPAQGGFVELTFGEAGHYPVVSHVMVDAERGAHGVVEVVE